jgi:O-antigen/teichoic acid export membrane protein
MASISDQQFPTLAGKSKSRRGTTVMLMAAAASAGGAYIFQIMGVRALGPVDFAPISILWTVFFVGFTVLLLPLEQLTIRRLTLSGGDTGALRESRRVVVGVLVLTVAAAVGFVVLTLDRFFTSNPVYILLVGMLFVFYGIFAVGRGFLAGRGRFAAYGGVVIGESVVRVLAAIPVVLLAPSAVGLGWAIVLSPLVMLLARPWRTPEHTMVVQSGTGTDTRFVAALLVAQAASQTALASGPVIVGMMGGSAVAVSIFFVTFTLLRGPITASYNLTARVLPTFTRMAAAGNQAGLKRWAVRLGLWGFGAAALTGLAAAALGPDIVAFLYGEEVRPAALLTGLAAVGVVAGLLVLFSTQILIAEGATQRLATAWIIAIVAMALAIVLAPGDPSQRVAVGFAVAHLVALAGIVVAVAVRPPVRA